MSLICVNSNFDEVFPFADEREINWQLTIKIKTSHYTRLLVDYLNMFCLIYLRDLQVLNEDNLNEEIERLAGNLRSCS